MQINKLFTPRPGSLLVKIIDLTEKDRTNKSGIIMPEMAESEQSIYSKAEVVRVGENYMDYKMQCEEGDIILISKAVKDKSSRFVIVDGIKYFQLFEADDFYGILED